MREVIRKLIETEDEAKRALESAKAEAERIVSGAHQQAQDLVARTRQDVRVEAEKMIDAATKEAEREKLQRIDRAVAEIQTQVHVERDVMQRAARSVVRCVCGYT